MVLFLVWWGHWKGGLGVGGPSGVSIPKCIRAFQKKQPPALLHV